MVQTGQFTTRCNGDRVIAIQELIRRWDSERELFNDDIAHT